MRQRVEDEDWIRETLKRAGVTDTVYVTPNTYDGGYEVRVGVEDGFVDYGAIDAQEDSWLKKFRK